MLRGRAKAEAADGRVAVGGSGVAGFSWTSWDMIQKLHGADQGHCGATDATRTDRGFHAAGNEEYPQVSGYSDGLGSAHCKTVGSAYVGSNPTPATTCENGP